MQENLEREQLNSVIEDLLYFLEEESNSAVWHIDLTNMQGRTYTRHHFLGYSPAEVPNTLDAWLTLIHPSDIAAVHEKIAEAIQGNRDRMDFEHRVRHRDGSWRWLHSVGVVKQRTADGKPQLLQGSCVEITHPRHTERLLKMSREVLAQFSRAQSLTDQLEGLVQAVQQHTDEAWAAILLTGPPQDRLQFAAGRDLPAPLQKTLCTIEMTARVADWAFHTPETFAGGINDSPMCEEFRTAALHAGFLGCATAAILDSQDHFLGIFVLLFSEVRVSTRELHELLQSSAKLAGVATEHWRNSTRLKKSEERLERAMWGAELGLWDANFRTREIFFSEQWNRMLGYEPGDIVNNLESMMGLVHPDDLPAVKEAWQQHITGNTPHVETEHRLKAKDGRWVWVADRARVVEYATDGSPLRAAGTQHDISRRKEIELELRRSEARFQAFMHYLPAIAFIKDRGGRYLFGNPQWAAQFFPNPADAAPDKLYGKTDFDLWPSKTASMIQTEDARITESEKIYEIYETGTDFQGNEKHWLVRKFLIPGGDEPLLGGFVLEVTQQRIAERSLRESEERYRKLAETARVVPWEWKCDARVYSYVGPQVETILGYTPAEWTAEGFWDANVHPTELEATLAFCRQQTLVNDYYEVEYRFRHKDGSWRWIHDVVSVFRTAGKAETLRGFMVDITARREIEEALRKSESRLRSVMSHAPDIILQLDRQRRIQYISRVIPPYTLEETLGTLVEHWLPPDEQQVCRETIDSVFSTGKSSEYFTRFEHPSAGVLWYSCSVGPVLVDGNVESVILISRDITSQKRTELAMRESENRYRLLADFSSDMIARLLPDGRFVYVSPSALSLTGYEPEELVGRTFEHLVPPEDIPRLYQEVSAVVEQGAQRVATYQLIRKDGKVIWAESTGRPLIDPESNRITALVVNTRDVTERLEASRLLRERERALAHAERLATMGQMASELAHEINQPLYAIANFADACQGSFENQLESIPVDVRNWLEQIGIQARRASDIVRRINHFVRKGEGETERVQINDCVRDVIPLFEINARRDNVLLQLDLQPNLPQVVVDRLLIEQVLTNLIRNGLESIKEANPPRKRLLIRTNFVVNQGVMVAVVDNGTGIRPGQFDQLFEPYFTSKEDGTGMGLSICRTAIESHGGRIWAANNASQGATFQFTIPAQSLDPPQSE